MIEKAEVVAPENYDEIGVTLSLDRRGRHNAYRVFINAGVVVRREILTEGRNGSKALDEAARSLSLLLHEHGRGHVSFSQPEPIKLFLEHKP